MALWCLLRGNVARTNPLIKAQPILLRAPIRPTLTTPLAPAQLQATNSPCSTKAHQLPQRMPVHWVERRRPAHSYLVPGSRMTKLPPRTVRLPTDIYSGAQAGTPRSHWSRHGSIPWNYTPLPIAETNQRGDTRSLRPYPTRTPWVRGPGTRTPTRQLLKITVEPTDHNWPKTRTTGRG